MTLGRAVAFVALLSVWLPLSAAPTITSARGDVLAGADIVISGSGFGSGPNVILFDDFEGGQLGAEIPISSGRVGQWSRVEGPQIYDSIARSGKASARIYVKGRSAIMTKTFAEPTTEVFFSFWVQVPPGTNFPGSVNGPREFSSNSSWKFTWLVDSSFDGTSSDLCLPTHVGSGSFMLAGNDFNLTYLSNSWWSWDRWVRISTYLKADTTRTTENGIFWFQALSEGKAPYVTTQSKAVFDVDGPSTKVWRYISFPGWLVSNGDTRPVYDDVYVAVGPNSRARVELGDAATYVMSRTLVLLTPTKWLPGSLTARVWNAESQDKAWYIYVTDGDGNVNSAGFPLARESRPSAPLLEVR